MKIRQSGARAATLFALYSVDTDLHKDRASFLGSICRLRPPMLGNAKNGGGRGGAFLSGDKLSIPGIHPRAAGCMAGWLHPPASYFA